MKCYGIRLIFTFLGLTRQLVANGTLWLLGQVFEKVNIPIKWTSIVNIGNHIVTHVCLLCYLLSGDKTLCNKFDKFFFKRGLFPPTTTRPPIVLFCPLSGEIFHPNSNEFYGGLYLPPPLKSWYEICKHKE